MCVLNAIQYVEIHAQRSDLSQTHKAIGCKKSGLSLYSLYSITQNIIFGLQPFPLLKKEHRAT